MCNSKGSALMRRLTRALPLRFCPLRHLFVTAAPVVALALKDQSVMVELRYQSQCVELPVMNIEELARESVAERMKRHGELWPSNVGVIFCKPSNCGKTNALLALNAHPALEQSKYVLLERLLARVPGIEYFAFDEYEQVVSSQEARLDSISVFDDIAYERQYGIRAFFYMGRHCRVDCFYLCQTYARIPKYLVRDNVNVLVLFRQDDMNL